ncbi:MAG: drug/metabolite transporter (DMT)-like permease, partial [Flavobacteriaceae bacterium]
QIVFYRSLIGLLIVVALFKRSLPKLTLKILKKHFYRNLSHLVGQYGWIIGIIYLSLSEVTAIEFTAPVWVIIIASIFLKEKITRIKVISIILCLLGVFVILKPGSDVFTVNSLIVLASAISYSITHVLTKTIVQSSSPLELIFIMCLTQTPISFFFAISDWETPLFYDYFWLILIGISALAAHFSLAKAFKENKISDLIVLDYLRLPILSLAGILIYNESFSLSLLLGGSIILIGNYLNANFT